MGLKEMEKKQNQLHKAVLLDSVDEVMFCDYLSVHPRLYEGCELDTATIDFINNHFYFYKVNPTTFEQYFITKLKHVSAQYNNMKRVEFNNMVFDVVTSRYVRKLVSDTTNELARTGGKYEKTTNTGDIKDDKSASIKQEGSTSYGKSETNTTKTNDKKTSRGDNTVDANNDNKQAQRNMTMLTSGNTFEGQFDWPNGASNIAENKENNHSNTHVNMTDKTEGEETVENKVGGTDKDTVTSDSTNTNKRTMNTKIDKYDIEELNDLGKNHNTDDENLDIIEGQGVDLIAKIWNYLAEPKSLDFLIDQLSTCFILVY